MIHISELWPCRYLRVCIQIETVLLTLICLVFWKDFAMIQSLLSAIERMKLSKELRPIKSIVITIQNNIHQTKFSISSTSSHLRIKFMYYVYMLLCEDNSIYTGITNDLERRFGQHIN